MTTVTYNTPGPVIPPMKTYGRYQFAYCMDYRVDGVLLQAMYYCVECGVPVFWFTFPDGDIQLVTHADWHYNQDRP